LRQEETRETSWTRSRDDRDPGRTARSAHRGDDGHLRATVR